MKYTIFLDMDGVICDFEQNFIDIADNKDKIIFSEHLDKYGISPTWKLVEKQGLSWWSKMPWKKDGKELWEYVKQFNPIILSAPSRDPLCIKGKTIWVNRELGIKQEPTLSPKHSKWDINSRFILNGEKYRFCKRFENSILIDDTPKKINAWKENGGIGILHTNTKDTINQLNKILNK